MRICLPKLSYRLHDGYFNAYDVILFIVVIIGSAISIDCTYLTIIVVFCKDALF